MNGAAAESVHLTSGHSCIEHEFEIGEDLAGLRRGIRATDEFAFVVMGCQPGDRTASV